MIFVYSNSNYKAKTHFFVLSVNIYPKYTIFLKMKTRLGRNIAVYRKKLHLTQSDFIERISQLAGISFRTATLSAWENGNSSPSSDLLPAIAEVLQVPLKILFSDENGEIPVIEEKPNNTAARPDLQLYEQAFKNAPEKTFHTLLEQHGKTLDELEKIRALNQNLEGKLEVSNSFIQQLMRGRKG